MFFYIFRSNAGVWVTIYITVLLRIPVDGILVADLIEIHIIAVRKFVKRIDHVMIYHFIDLRLPPAQCDKIRKRIRRNQRVQLLAFVPARRNKVNIDTGLFRNFLRDNIFSPSCRKP